MAKDEDYELVEKFLAGDESAFNQLVRKYQKRIYWHARQMLGNHLDADEVTQEVLIVLYNKLKTFGFKSSLFTWIYRIVNTRSINQLRKNKLKKIFSLEDYPGNDLRSDRDLSEDIDNREKLQKLDAVVESLPIKQKEVFILRNFDELSYEEISKITGRSVGGLKANYFHALKKVMEQMNESGQ